MAYSDISQVEREYTRPRLETYAPPERLSVWQWAEKNVVLSELATEFHGPYKSERCPYAREPMDTFTDPDIKYLVLPWCAQSGKTENIVLIPALYSIAQDPGPVLFVIDSEDNAREFSETRFQPLVDGSPNLAELKPADPDKYKVLMMFFTRAIVRLVGSNSPGKLAQKAIRYLFADEIDKYPPASNKETDALALALHRIRSYLNSMVVLTSTPTVPDGNIWKWWRRSDQRHLMVVCPHCRHPQKLIMGCDAEYEAFKGVVLPPHQDKEKRYRLCWPKDCSISELDHRAWYECENPECIGRIYDAALNEAVAVASWKSFGERSDTAGFHLSALNVPWVPLGTIAADFLRAKRYPDQLQDVYNNTLAMPWDAVEQGTDTVQLFTNMETTTPENSYRLNTSPAGCIFLTVGIDVQAHEIWYVVRGWGAGEKSWLIDFGKEAVETDEIDNFIEAVQRIMGRDYGRPIILAGIDSGWGTRTAEVYTIARVLPRIVCTKGRRSNVTKSSDGKDVPIPRPRRIDRMPDGKELKSGPLLYVPSTSYWKRWLFGRLNANPAVWHWPEGLEESHDGKTYKRHMESEREVYKKNPRTGRAEKQWVVRMGYDANHLLDCEIINAVVEEIVLTAGGQKKMTPEEVEPLADALWERLCAIDPASNPIGTDQQASESTGTEEPKPTGPRRRKRRKPKRHM